MLILASASPRRHELLLAAGIEHQVRPANIGEVRLPGEPGPDLVRRLAIEKNRAAACAPGEIVLSADTTVCLGAEVFEKPLDRDDARRMLKALSGKDHWVYTGICLRNARREIADVAATRVTMSLLAPEEIETYLDSGEADDKAGAYGIQGLASKFITEIDGCYNNVVGLPVALVYQYLKAI